jgi:hypothetical protein
MRGGIAVFGILAGPIAAPLFGGALSHVGILSHGTGAYRSATEAAISDFLFYLPAAIETLSCFAIPNRSANFRMTLAVVLSIVAVALSFYLDLVIACLLNGDCL